MGNQDGFTGGFWLGTLLGGAIGAAVGVTLGAKYAQRLTDHDDEPDDVLETDPAELPEDPRSETRIEYARQGLEDKIAQLNDTIDDVRRQLGSHNGRAQGTASLTSSNGDA